MKTDLAKILSVSGRHGLYRYVAQARNGAIAENLEDGQRTVFGATTRITTLEDIAIFTSAGEMKIAEVFKAMKKVLGTGEAPTSKSSDKEITDFFGKAVPDYDSDRFYLSHMKKVIDWYNQLAKHASLDFVTDKDREKEASDEKA